MLPSLLGLAIFWRQRVHDATYWHDTQILLLVSKTVFLMLSDVDLWQTWFVDEVDRALLNWAWERMARFGWLKRFADEVLSWKACQHNEIIFANHQPAHLRGEFYQHFHVLLDHSWSLAIWWLAARCFAVLDAETAKEWIVHWRFSCQIRATILSQVKDVLLDDRVNLD